MNTYIYFDMYILLFLFLAMIAGIGRGEYLIFQMQLTEYSSKLRSI